MSLESFIPFVLATILILIIPGPTIILVISQAVTHGRKSVVPLVAGVLMGDFLAMTLSLLGLGAIMAASSTMFSFFKWIGATYLIYLGVRLWKANPNVRPMQGQSASVSGYSLFKSSFIVTALNPKSIAFFVAFLPQFIDTQMTPQFQLPLLGGTFLILATLNATMYAVFAGQLREYMQSGKVRKWFSRCGAGAMVGAGLITAGLKNSS